ncbi:TIM barrel protein [Fervidobacterium islandicum]|uniref:TIM barrel protein n=1 Tax=Fervidobacterium islandicum TaxID=2423 RepID=UPI003A6B0ECD
MSLKRKRKCVSTSLIRANVSLLKTLPNSMHYELTFFKKEDLPVVLDFLNEKGATFGIHAPFVFRYQAVHPNPTSLSTELRKETYEKNEQCCKLAKEIGAEYVVIHFPNAKQTENWLKDKNILKEAIEHVRNLSNYCQVRIENVYYNEYFHNAKDYRWFLEQTGTTLCLDLGHLLLDSERYGFSTVEFVDVVEEYISEVHLYYADSKVYEKCHHAPWGCSAEFKILLERIRSLNCDFTLEASNDCQEGLEKLIAFWEGL